MQKTNGSLIGYMSNMVKTNGGINLAQGIPSFSPPKKLLNTLSELALNSNYHQYAPGKGNNKLLQLLSEKYNKPLNNFLILNGATEAISTIFTYLTIQNPSASILGFDPIYESYKHLSRIFNKEFFTLDISKNICFQTISNFISKKNIKIIFIASPGNPLGKIWTESQINNLLEIAIQHNAYVIIDAVYSDLYFDKKPYYPIQNLNKNVFYVNSFSKKLSITGWRLGYLLCHSEHMENIMDIHDYIGLSSPTILQEALYTYLHKNNFGENYSSKLRNLLKNNYSYIQNELSELGFKIIQAEGGYFIWCELPFGFECGFDFAIKLYEQTNVAVVPGIHFSENGKRKIRLNIAHEKSDIELAISKIKNFIGK